MTAERGPAPINVRQEWQKFHVIQAGSFGDTATESAQESFTPLNLVGGRMPVVDIVTRIRRPSGVGNRALVSTAIYLAEFDLVSNGRRAGGGNIVALTPVFGPVTAPVTRVSDLHGAYERVIHAQDTPVDLRPDLNYLLWIKLEGDAQYVYDPNSFASAPGAYTGPFPRRNTLLRRMASTTIYAPVYQLRTAFGRFLYGDPATEK